MKKLSETEIKIGFSATDLAVILRELSDKDRESFTANLLASVSSEYASFSLRGLITALRELSEEGREFLIENLLAAISPEYLESIKEARRDYGKGRTVPYKELFKK